MSHLLLAWPVWLFLLALLLTIVYTTRAGQGYDRYADRPATTASMCGASNGELVCTLRPHETEWHQDLTRSTRYHSGTFRLRVPS